MLSRALDCDYINLCFSGSARGEQSVAAYIGSLDMSVFVLDYDHNAPDSDHLRRTHYNFYRTVREKRPDTPVIMVSKPDVLSVDPGPALPRSLRKDGISSVNRMKKPPRRATVTCISSTAARSSETIRYVRVPLTRATRTTSGFTGFTKPCTRC